jgi:two-component system chemotaxis response regulator CheB
MTSARAAASAPLRVLVVDDSQRTRDAVVAMLRRDPLVEVVGLAADGEEALHKVIDLKPGCICLDLQMPRMDGFTFLRVLMAKQPTPVVVLSSISRKQDVFKALELGALEFVVKPSGREGESDLAAIAEDLLQKLAVVRRLRVEAPRKAADAAGGPGEEGRAAERRPPRPKAAPARARTAGEGEPRVALHRPPGIPSRLVVIGASTGGPGAVARLLAAMPRGLPVGYAVAQHMPEHFTTTFAERLARTTGLDVREASDGDELVQGRVLVAPGGRHLVIERTNGPQSALRAAVQVPAAGDTRHAPSIDALFESAAQAMGDRVCAVVLTGMGNDGRQGVARVKDAGGLALAESERTAVVFGMPRQAAESGKVDAVLSLEEIAAHLRRFAERKP